MCDNCGSRQGRFIKQRIYMGTPHKTSRIIRLCKDIEKCNKARDVIDAKKVSGEGQWTI